MSNPESSSHIEHLLKLDEVRQRFEDAWRNGLQPSLSRYLQEASAVDRATLFADLLGIELELRRDAGESPEVSEYQRTFPSYASNVAAVFEEAADDAVFGRHHLEIGTVLGDYRIERTLGHGGMGVVYEAEQLSLRRRVALKALAPNRPVSSQSRERFFREARAAASLHHTNIVPVIEVDERDGVLFYVMQLIDGRPLSSVVAELRQQYSGAPRARIAAAAGSQTAIPNHPRQAVGTAERPAEEDRSDNEQDLGAGDPARALTTPVAVTGTTVLVYGGRDYWLHVSRMGRQVAESLQYAHERGILHRDIKPGNLLIDPLGSVWVTDFGLAKMDDGDLTEAGDVIGTLRYLPPEAFDGRTDARSDIYSLGLTLYELLALRSPFNDRDRSRTVQQISQAQIVPLPKVAAGVPRDLATIVGKATQRDPRDRYQTAQQMADDLNRFVSDEPILARRHSPAELLSRWVRLNPVVAALTAATALLLVLAAAGSIFAAIHFRSLQLQQFNTAQEREQQRKAATLSASRARKAEQRALLGLVDLHCEQSDRHLEQRDYLSALLSSVQALRLVDKPSYQDAESGNPMLGESQPGGLTLSESLRYRIAALLEQLPPLAGRKKLDAYNWSQQVPDPFFKRSEQNWPELQFTADGELSVVSRSFDAAFRWKTETDAVRRIALPAASAQIETPSRTGATSSPSVVRFSRDGRYAVRSTGSGKLELWSCEPERLVCALESDSRGDSPPLGCWLSPDTKRLVSGFAASPFEAHFFLWDTQSGRLVHSRPFKVQSTSPPQVCAQFSRDGSRLMLGGVGANVFDVAQGTALITDAARVPMAAAFCGQGRFLVSAQRESVRVRDLNLPVDSPPTVEIPLPENSSVASMACDDSGRWAVAGTYTGEIYVVDLTKRRLAGFPLRHSSASIERLEMNPRTDAVAAADAEGLVRVWSLPSGVPLTAPLPLSEPVRSLAWRGDSERLAAATVSGDLAVWELPQPEKHAIGTDMHWSVLRSPDGSKLASWQGFSNVQIRDLTTRPPRVTAAPSVSNVFAAGWHPDGTRIAFVTQTYGTSAYEMRLWKFGDPQSPQLTVRGNHRLAPLRCVTRFVDDARRFVISTDQEPVIIDIDQGCEVPAPDAAKFKAGPWELCAMSNRFIAGCRRVASREETNHLRIWTPAGRIAFDTTLPADRPVREIAFSPDGAVLAAAGDFGLRLWRSRDWQPIPMDQSVGVLRIQRLCFDDGSGHVAFVDDNSVCRVADVRTGNNLGNSFHVRGNPRSLTFSPDAKRLAVLTSQHGITVWDWSRGVLLTPAYFLGGSLFEAVFSADGSTLGITHVRGDLNWLYVPLAVQEPWNELLLRVARTTGYGLTPTGQSYRLTAAEWKEVRRAAGQ